MTVFDVMDRVNEWLDELALTPEGRMFAALEIQDALVRAVNDAAVKYPTAKVEVKW